MSTINPNELVYQTNPDVKVEDVLNGNTNSVSDKYGWLEEVQKIIHRMIQQGDERLEDEFKVQCGIQPVVVEDNKKKPEDLGVVVYLRDVNKEHKDRWMGERLAVPVSNQWDGVFLMFSDADTKEELWKAENTRVYKRTFDEFVTDVKPMDVEWLYSTWQKAIDFAYLLIADDRISAKLLSDCRNQEIKKWLVKRFGQERFKNGEGKMLDEEYCFKLDNIPVPVWEGKYWNGEAWVEVPHEADLEKTGQYLFDIEVEGEQKRFVKVNDTSTDREYILEVPNTDSDGPRRGMRARQDESDYPINSVHNAVAWTFSYRKPEDWHPKAEA